ncbi:hypothetical protein AXF42_Ash006249 [Apostasia shenzhenica]|uniref:BED-type domain-containing protein n=1 Tax=Apostasia shenzhenica TaxID=1088818 RepID=A0A2I0AYI5_9ASPA|nr:hypothetical protein AXF42_Ash006249 [Apostasia shenzhenica]
MSVPSPSSVPSTQDSIDISQPSTSIRQRSDISWKYVTDIRSNDGKKWLKCDFCQKIFKGGGIHRVKLHLARRKGDVEML